MAKRVTCPLPRESDVSTEPRPVDYDVAHRPSPDERNKFVWFLFDPTTGETLRDGFNAKPAALVWGYSKFGFRQL